MAAVTLTPADLTPFAAGIPAAKAEAMIADVLALAARVAPCILDDDFAHAPAAKAILRAAVLRWHDAGSGATTQQAAGPFSVSTTVARTAMFWPSEITNLQGLCSGAGGGAFAVDTVTLGRAVHADICSLNFGAVDCSCGAVLTLAYPLWGDGVSAIVFPYGETIHLRRFSSSGDDGLGNVVPSWGEPVAVPGCAVAPAGSSEPRDGLSERVVESAQLFIPPGFPIGPGDHVERGAETYEVEGYPADWRQPQTGWVPGPLVVTIRRIEG